MFIRTKLIAHRGYSSIAPENTIAAFEKAIQHGYKDIEFDVQLTKDNVAVVLHDDTVDRTTNGSGLLKNHTYDELKKLDAGSWFNDRHSDQTVPSLLEVLETFKGRARLHIELKGGQPGLPAEVARLLKATGWVKGGKPRDIKNKWANSKVIISSFERSLLVKSLSLLPETVRHELLVEKVTEEGIQWAAAHKLYSYHPTGGDITPELIKKARKHNLHIGAWWMSAAEQDVSKIKGARYAFVDAPHEHRRNFMNIRI